MRTWTETGSNIDLINKEDIFNLAKNATVWKLFSCHKDHIKPN